MAHLSRIISNKKKSREEHTFYHVLQFQLWNGKEPSNANHNPALFDIYKKMDF